MEFEGARKAAHAPNLTPLIDVVFLLLVFFMLTAHFVQEEIIPINLPTAESSEDISDEDPLEVLISAEGNLMFKGEEISAEDLEEKLAPLLKSRKNKGITLRGDMKSGLGETVKVLDAVRKAGAEAVDIVTQQPE